MTQVYTLPRKPAACATGNRQPKYIVGYLSWFIYLLAHLVHFGQMPRTEETSIRDTQDTKKFTLTTGIRYVRYRAYRTGKGIYYFIYTLSLRRRRRQPASFPFAPASSFSSPPIWTGALLASARGQRPSTCAAATTRPRSLAATASPLAPRGARETFGAGCLQRPCPASSSSSSGSEARSVRNRRSAPYATAPCTSSPDP